MELNRVTYRALHLIDLENLCGSGRLSYEAVRAAYQTYGDEIGIQEDDFVLVAAGPGNRIVVCNGWPSAYYKFRDGPDGADIAIAEFISEFHSHHLYSRVFFGSGDGELAPYAELLKRSGLPVVVVSRPGSTSNRLKEFEVIDFPEFPIAV